MKILMVLTSHDELARSLSVLPDTWKHIDDGFADKLSCTP